MGTRKSKKTYHLLNDYHLLAYETLDSTNEEARRLAEGGASHGAVIWAKEQTAGRGRLKREWESKPGNLFVSILLSPNRPLAEAAQLSFVSGVAAVRALEPLLPGGGEFTCKWPNDILLEGKKLGGILLESFTTQPEPDDRRKKPRQWVVVGVGVNIDGAPDEALYPATCLKDAGVELVSAKIVLTRFIEAFMECYDQWVREGFAPLRAAWVEHAYGIGKPVTVQLGDDEVTGTFAGISESGELLVEPQAGGQPVAVNCGDVFFTDQSITTRTRKT